MESVDLGFVHDMGDVVEVNLKEHGKLKGHVIGKYISDGWKHRYDILVEAWEASLEFEDIPGSMVFEPLPEKDDKDE